MTRIIGSLPASVYLKSNSLFVLLLKRMGYRGELNAHLGTYFRADFTEFLFVSIALTLTEILVDYDRT
jgi:hypothetical protein